MSFVRLPLTENKTEHPDKDKEWQGKHAREGIVFEAPKRDESVIIVKKAAATWVCPTCGVCLLPPLSPSPLAIYRMARRPSHCSAMTRNTWLTRRSCMFEHIERVILNEICEKIESRFSIRRERSPLRHRSS